jgi:hypothetical protein
VNRLILTAVALAATAGVTHAQPVTDAHRQFPQPGAWEADLNWSTFPAPYQNNNANNADTASVTDPISVSTSTNVTVNSMLLNQGGLFIGANRGFTAQTMSVGEGATVGL